MNIFKRALEYNKLAKAFNGFYPMVQELRTKAQYHNVEEDLFVLAFIARKEIIDRMDQIKYKMSTRIVVPVMPGYQKTLEYAYVQTVGQLLSIADQEGSLEEVENILDKGDLYYQTESKIPSQIKHIMNL